MHTSEAGKTPAPRPVRVCSVKAPLPTVVRFLGQYKGLMTHWRGRRSTPCQGPTKCPQVLHKEKAIWKGYAPVLEWSEADRVWWAAVLEITELMEERLHNRLLRSQVWIFTRTNSEDNESPVEGQCIAQGEEVDCPDPFDIEPVLKRFYHVTELLLGVPNPIPPRLILGPVQEPGPGPLEPLIVEPAVPFTADKAFNLREQLKKIGINLSNRGKLQPSTNGTAAKGVDHE
jgi:hypothetical protein